MLRRNLVIIAISVLSLIFAGNAFGQKTRSSSRLTIDGLENPAKTRKRKRKVKSVWDDTDIVHRQRHKNKSRKIRRKHK